MADFDHRDPLPLTYRPEMLIGLSGYAGSGKDTVAGFLAEYGYKRYAFADALKDEVADLWPNIKRIVQQIGWDAAKREYVWIRTTLQEHGVWRRETEGPFYWVNQVIERINTERPEKVCITDVRFENELVWVNDYGHSVWVSRPGVGPVNGHVSEKRLSTTYSVSNDGSLGVLEFEVISLLKHYVRDASVTAQLELEADLTDYLAQEGHYA